MAEQVSKLRRPHHKSRNGCSQCKQRKVKCDEQKPTCKKCESYGATCSFLQTYPQKSRLPTVTSMLASPEPTISSVSSPASSAPLPTKFSMLDMELLHHWTTVTCQASIDFHSGMELYRTVIVRFGFEYPFVMHQLLAITAMHLTYLRPRQKSTYRHAADSHAASALSLFQPEIANLTTENCHACFGFSTSFWMYVWSTQELAKPSTLFFKPSLNHQSTDIQWVKLHRGTNTILTTMWQALQTGPCHALFDDWKDLDPERPDPLHPEDEKHLYGLAEAWKDLPETKKDVLNTNLKITVRAFSMLDIQPGPSKLAAGISWFSHITDEFIQLVSEKMPEALLIVCYYCVVLKKLGGTWWMEGKAENLLRTIMTELGGGWEIWAKWPIEKVLGENQVLPRLEY